MCVLIALASRGGSPTRPIESINRGDRRQDGRGIQAPCRRLDGHHVPSHHGCDIAVGLDDDALNGGVVARLRQCESTGDSLGCSRDAIGLRQRALIEVTADTSARAAGVRVRAHTQRTSRRWARVLCPARTFGKLRSIGSLGYALLVTRSLSESFERPESHSFPVQNARRFRLGHECSALAALP